MNSNHRFTPWILVAPAVTWVLVFAIWPFLRTIYTAFTNARPLRPGRWVGLENFQKLFDDPSFTYALTTVAIYVVVCVPLLTILPLLVALLMEKNLPFISAFRTTAYFPVVASVVVVGIIWGWMFDSRGIINQSLSALGLIDKPVPFLVERWWIIAVAISLTVWKGLGYYMVVYLAALGNVSPELHEAAAIDGAGTLRRFFHVTLPGVRNAMFLVAALIATSAMRIFTELYVLTNGKGGPGGQAQSLVMMVQNVGKGINGKLGYASAISVVLFLLTFIPLLLVAYVNQADQIAARRASKRAKRERKQEGAR
ncbi:carbohydrate ABC transporter permease [Buchananella hordeovulneris]|uniref:ABC transporter permease n=1 Tax=Buchananella hordeovulneris TaxID=52770 RepID=A0A1Q5PX70_9ACTO|nr:sugar ABC transporter permease [Buchananella hordeovulneris]MDO5081060.1 sugar ABC transporter permease [Buchananella hordeovulneris]OKL52191.1 ABC transporter permease [Buchananella hordeovulneris]RRD51741.1 sugar ABC transporter permease [Buchananella hordeovulneris]